MVVHDHTRCWALVAARQRARRTGLVVGIGTVLGAVLHTDLIGSLCNNRQRTKAVVGHLVELRQDAHRKDHAELVLAKRLAMVVEHRSSHQARLKELAHHRLADERNNHQAQVVAHLVVLLPEAHRNKLVVERLAVHRLVVHKGLQEEALPDIHLLEDNRPVADNQVVRALVVGTQLADSLEGRLSADSQLEDTQEARHLVVGSQLEDILVDPQAEDSQHRVPGSRAVLPPCSSCGNA